MLFISSLLGSCRAAPDPALQAYHSLKRIELRTSRLVWHEEYARDLGQAVNAVNGFLSGQEAAADARLAASLQAALFDYELSGRLWGVLRQAGQNAQSQAIERVCIKRMGSTGGLLAAHLQSLGAMPLPGADGCAMDEIEITRQVSFLWAHAADELKIAGRLLGL